MYSVARRIRLLLWCRDMAIPQTFDEAFERVEEHVSIFSENESKYLSPGYSEAQARLEFIDRFWIALGWDVNREPQHDPYVHDEHHQHVHDEFAPLGEPHSHSHRHERMVHRHPHYPDIHHRHAH